VTEMPALLTEDELKSMPMGELLALVKYMGISSDNVVKAVKVYADNIKTIRDFMEKNKTA
jgi:hypothetical protein